MTSSSAKRNNWLIHLAALVVVIAGMKTASSLVVPFLLAIFLAIICTPLLYWLKSRKIPGLLGLILILGIIVGVWLLLAMVIGSTLAEFSRNVPYYQDRLSLITREILQILADQGFLLNSAKLAELLNPGKIMLFAAGMLNSLGTMVTNAFVILITFVFLLLEAAGIPDKLRAVSGGSNASLSHYVSIAEGVNRYLAIKTITSIATGGAVYILLYVQKVDFAILWALLAFLLNFIPNIGSILAAIPAVLLSLIQLGPAQAAISAMGFLLINSIIGSIIEPRAMGKGIGLSTLVVFLSLAFWGWVLGPVGMLLSVPLTMTVKIALGERDETRWIALLLGSNKEVSAYLNQQKRSETAEQIVKRTQD